MSSSKIPVAATTNIITHIGVATRLRIISSAECHKIMIEITRSEESYILLILESVETDVYIVMMIQRILQIRIVHPHRQRIRIVSVWHDAEEIRHLTLHIIS